MAMNESRDRLWVVWLWIIMMAVVAGCGLLTVLYARQAGQKETARVIAQHELLARHWTKLEPDQAFRGVIDTLANGAKSDVTGFDWSAKFIDATGPGAAVLDPFENKALRTVEGGTDEVWEYSWRGVIRYARAIRGDQLCLSCHATTKANGVIGTISIRFGPAADQPDAPIALSTGTK